jgi:hypothetical protein
MKETALFEAGPFLSRSLAADVAALLGIPHRGQARPADVACVLRRGGGYAAVGQLAAVGTTPDRTCGIAQSRGWHATPRP